MSISDRARLLLALAVLLAVTAAWALGLSWFGPRHFIPEQKMAAAIAIGGGCDAFFGDSRMDAVLNGQSFHGDLRSAGSERCAVDLAIGGTDVSAAALTLRRYLDYGIVPARVVLGMVGDSLLDPPPLRPDKAVGNNAIHLTWSRLSDVAREVPDLPAGGIGAWDAAFRFVVARATPIGQYQSLLWSRIQQIDRRLAGTEAAGNRFGAISDMAQLGAQLQRSAVARLRAALTNAGPHPRYGRWFTEIQRLAASVGAKLIVVELPMPERYRQAVTDLDVAARYRQALARDLHAEGAVYLDFSDWARGDDDAFMDDLHLGPPGARAFSLALGVAIGADQSTSAPRRRPK
jgi:hypothetical protein